MKIDYKAIIEAYNNGESMNSIAHAFGTYATTVKRILEREGVELRHDGKSEGSLYVKNGEKLIEWAKAQGRLVSKAELAEVIGTKRLSPSYFIKYPELGQYIKPREQKELQDYTQKLYDWLKKHDIPYKPSDRTKIGLSVTALLLEEYSNLAIDLYIRPLHVSKKKYSELSHTKSVRAKEVGIQIVFLTKEHFDDLDGVYELIDSLKKEGN